MGSGSSAEATRTWQCKCEKMKITLTGEPLTFFDCHCHGCVSAMRHVDAKESPGTSASSSSGGVCKALFYFEQMQFDPSLLENGELEKQLHHVKVGDKGVVVRSYTRCCNTLMFTAGGKGFPGNFRPLNRNCIRNGDGSAYVPPGVVHSVQASSAFEPDLVPEPKSGIMPCGIGCSFLGGICKSKCCCAGGGQISDHPALSPDSKASDIEVVEITWESRENQSSAV
eukprot:TRINITY_DN7488_c0_g1_i1.p1 TRINITY_DN7488_c0_g1~~TRINITY_DN7488_c0_g1_i1.p1  ORF type:complete len:226 (+),score=14.71 TRINITY_DN7488_c0_g1_i1:283-960(+)